jgi:hypothetical protein
MMQNYRWIGLVLIPLVMFLFLWPGFGDVLRHPNGFLFTNTGDGLKNYFNLGYYLKYDHGLAFTGVNYPYGENLLFTDTHPFYALFLNFIDDHIWPVASNSVAIINLSILFGMVAGALILFLILHHFKLPWWYAATVAVCIAFLSPQWNRIHGHLSLSYSFVIPLFWLLALKYERASAKSIWLACILVYSLVVGGIHMYFLAMGAAFILLYSALCLWSSRTARVENHARSYILLMLAVIVPLLAIFFLSSATDIVKDRPVAPYGFYVYHASLESVFLPHYSSITTFLSKIFNISINWEGRAFVGIPVLIFLVGLLTHLIYQGRNIKTLTKVEDLPLSNYGIAAILVLLFSMCIPFEWGLRFIPEWISPLKQFRALGRFSWVFFYIFNVIAAIYFFRISRQLRSLGIHTESTALLILIIAAWIFDAGAFYLNHGPVALHPNDKLENTDDEYLNRFSSTGTSVNDFQAIMALPLVAIRTDKMTFESNLSAHNEAMKCAFHTGLPLVQSSASRPSLSQTLSSIQLISSPSIRKERLDDMDQRPLLLLYTKGSPLTKGEENLLQRSEIFWEDSYIRLGRLPLSVFQDSVSSMLIMIDRMRNGSMQVEKSREMICTPNCDGVLFESFEKEGTDRVAFYGDHALYSPAESLIIFDEEYPVTDSTPREVSFWIYIDPSYAGMPSYEYLTGTDSQHLLSAGKTETRDTPEVYKLWVRVQFQLQPGLHHRIVLHGKKTTVDNLMIKSPEQNIFISDDQGMLFNNYALP